MAQPTHIGVPRKTRRQKIVTESPTASPTFTVFQEYKHITTMCALCSHTLLMKIYSMSQLQDPHYILMYHTIHVVICPCSSCSKTAIYADIHMPYAIWLISIPVHTVDQGMCPVQCTCKFIVLQLVCMHTTPQICNYLHC